MTLIEHWWVDINDDDILLMRGEDEFFSTDHDEVGWQGAGMLERLADELNQAGL